MKKYHLILYLSLIILSNCSFSENTKNTSEKKELKTIMIHCGVTIYQPMAEIAGIIEKRENCKIIITKGGSGNLYQSITSNKIGDLYLPGSEKYIETAQKEGYVTEKVFVGKNQAAIMVKKGNPKNIPASIESLLDTNLRIVIGNHISGSIGKETKSILVSLNIYDKITERVEYVTVGSPDLIKALKNNEADITINWHATATWDENKKFVEILQINEPEIFKPKKLYLGLLTFSQNPELAKKIMDYASSDEGIAIFEKYGLY